MPVAAVHLGNLFLFGMNYSLYALKGVEGWLHLFILFASLICGPERIEFEKYDDTSQGRTTLQRTQSQIHLFIYGQLLHAMTPFDDLQ